MCLLPSMLAPESQRAAFLKELRAQGAQRQYLSTRVAARAGHSPQHRGHPATPPGRGHSGAAFPTAPPPGRSAHGRPSPVKWPPPRGRPVPAQPRRAPLTSARRCSTARPAPPGRGSAAAQRLRRGSGGGAAGPGPRAGGRGQNPKASTPGSLGYPWRWEISYTLPQPAPARSRTGRNQAGLINTLIRSCSI